MFRQCSWRQFDRWAIDLSADRYQICRRGQLRASETVEEVNEKTQAFGVVGIGWMRGWGWGAGGRETDCREREGEIKRQADRQRQTETDRQTDRDRENQIQTPPPYPPSKPRPKQNKQTKTKNKKRMGKTCGTGRGMRACLDE